MCTSHREASNDLCKSIAAVTRRLCSEFVDPEGLSALVACRLIAHALDKNPGVRPIGISETHRRIIARALLSTFKDDILMVAGPIQLCAGQESGCDAAVHVMQKLFNSPEVEAVLLFNATNALNSINRQTALSNIQHICPVISTILINTYRDDVNLFIDGEKLYQKKEQSKMILWQCLCMHWHFYHLSSHCLMMQSNRYGMQMMQLLVARLNTFGHGGTN